MGIRDVVDGFGGFATTRELLAHGATERMLTAAVRAGIVLRARNGWYSTRSASDPEFVAVRVGGRLTGLSAIAAMGGWVWPRTRRIHVAVSPVASRIRRPRDPSIVVHWCDDSDAGSRTMVSLVDALVRVALDEDLDTAIACFDWARASGRLDLVELESTLLKLPLAAQSIREWLGTGSQSILESVAAVRVRRCGWSVRPQVRTGLLGSTDLLIGEQVALELDGRQFHESTFESDRRKDLITTIEGRHAIRVSARMMREVWPDVEAAIRAALAARLPHAVGNSRTLPRLPHGSQRARVPRRRVSGVSGGRQDGRQGGRREYRTAPAPLQRA